MKFSAASLVLALIAAPSFAAEPYVLTPQGLGPVRIGMSVPEAEKALGAKLKVDLLDVDIDEACGFAARADKREANIGYMVEQGRITRIDILPATGRGDRDVMTAAGIGVGASEAEAQLAYGDALKLEPHPYDNDDSHYLVVDEPDHRRGVIFETHDGRVESFRAGLYPAVEYSEGCA